MPMPQKLPPPHSSILTPNNNFQNNKLLVHFFNINRKSAYSCVIGIFLWLMTLTLYTTVVPSESYVALSASSSCISMLVGYLSLAFVCIQVFSLYNIGILPIRLPKNGSKLQVKQQQQLQQQQTAEEATHGTNIFQQASVLDKYGILISVLAPGFLFALSNLLTAIPLTSPVALPLYQPTIHLYSMSIIPW